MLVFVNGTFDLLHSGHIKLLKSAKDLGGFVIVAIDSDPRVESIKGPGRPVNNQNERKAILEAIKYVDKVIVFDTGEELEQIIEYLQPDYMVKGSDYKDTIAIGQQFCKEVIYVPRTARSTTETIKNISSR